jgi:hypothetical protein
MTEYLCNTGQVRCLSHINSEVYGAPMMHAGYVIGLCPDLMIPDISCSVRHFWEHVSKLEYYLPAPPLLRAS